MFLFLFGRPLYLPVRSLVVVETFSISSSVSLDNSSSTLRYDTAAVFIFIFLIVLEKKEGFLCTEKCVVHRIILDEAALFLSDKNNAVSVNLVRGKWTIGKKKCVCAHDLRMQLQ